MSDQPHAKAPAAMMNHKNGLSGVIFPLIAGLSAVISVGTVSRIRADEISDWRMEWVWEPREAGPICS